MNLVFLRARVTFNRRLWNYNKSRIHSYRGARFVQITLDDSFIFRGEIAKAPGILNGSEENAEGALSLFWIVVDVIIISTATCSTSTNTVIPHNHTSQPSSLP